MVPLSAGSAGSLPLLSPSRLLTAAPLFVLLCLNELAQQPPGPFHHFHAPIVPLVLWAMAAGVGRLVRTENAALASTLTPSPSPGGEGSQKVGERGQCWRLRWLVRSGRGPVSVSIL